MFDDIFAALGPPGDLYFSRGHTTTVFYNEVALGRWLEKTVQSLGIQVITGAVLGDVSMRDGYVTSADFGTRYGNVRVRASGYVDASGDAALTWQAGLPCWEPSRPIYGSQQFIVENLHEEHKPEAGEVDAVFAARGEESGLLRRGGLAFFFPGRGTAVMNVTHIDAPLDPISASRAMFEGRDQADRALELLRAEFPKAFGEARVRAYGFPGRRQTRWIKGAHQLTVDEVRSGVRFDDAVARTAWPVELHDRSDGYVWEMFPADHVHYVPLRSLLPPDAHNLVAAGRCADGDAAALSSVRVMGPCSAMGAAAAHALDLAFGQSAGTVRITANLTSGSVHRDRHRASCRSGSPPTSAIRRSDPDDPRRRAERLMFLTEDEKRMRDGAEGDAVAAAMDLLIRYGFALDAERLCDIRNVAGTMTQPSPVKARLVAEGGWDKAFAVINLDSDLDLSIPSMRVPTCQLQHGFGPDSVDIVPYPPENVALQEDAESFYGRHGVNILATCTPVPGREPAAARRALRVDGVVGRDLRELGARRADQLRGDRVHRRRLADREGPVLGQPPGREPARHPPGRRARADGRELPGLGDARLLRGRGRGRGPPGDHRGHRPARPDRAEALRRGRRHLGRGRALPHSRGSRRRRRRWRRRSTAPRRCPSRWCTGRPSGGRCTRR